MPAQIRDLAAIADCRAVAGLQAVVWGRESEIVPASVLAASAKRGGILIGAYDGGASDGGERSDPLVGFVWSMPGWREGRPTHWSHMLGVDPGARRHGIGEALKRAQRARALAQGVELIEWTFDPLQAPNAHLNVTRLGAIATTYLVDAYGEMTGPLHRGTPTDRLIAEWWIAAPHVTRRLALSTALEVRSADTAAAPLTIEGDARGVGDIAPDLDARRVLVPVPANFTALQQEAPDVARQWRLATRTVFMSYLPRGYRVVDFTFDRDSGAGAYLLARSPGP